MTRRTRSSRLVVVALLATMVLAACSGEEDVPEDQVLRPAAAPEGWIEQDLAGVSFATPPAWSELSLPDPAAGTVRAGYADEPGPSGSTGGIVVMVLAEPRLTAKAQTQTFVTSARNREQAGEEEMTQISWPGAETAWYSTYVAKVGTGEPAPHPTSHLVLDLEDGQQVQVTVRAEEGTPAADALERALATVQVGDDVAVPDPA